MKQNQLVDKLCEAANKLALMKRFPASELAFVKSAKEFAIDCSAKELAMSETKPAC